MCSLFTSALAVHKTQSFQIHTNIQQINTLGLKRKSLGLINK